MKELSEHILDITKNSVSAGAGHIDIELTEDEAGWLTIVIRDDGRGMSEEFLANVLDPFTTTRTTRKVGMGLPLYRLTAELTGGELRVESAEGVGTTVIATCHLPHLDCPPMGDLPGTVALLIQGSPDTEFRYRHSTPSGTVELDTRELREVLGEDVSLAEPEVFSWIRDYLNEQEAQL